MRGSSAERRSAIARVASLEPSSTRTASHPPRVWAPSESSVAASVKAASRAGMMTETAGAAVAGVLRGAVGLEPPERREVWRAGLAAAAPDAGACRTQQIGGMPSRPGATEVHGRRRGGLSRAARSSAIAATGAPRQPARPRGWRRSGGSRRPCVAGRGGACSPGARCTRRAGRATARPRRARETSLSQRSQSPGRRGRPGSRRPRARARLGRPPRWARRSGSRPEAAPPGLRPAAPEAHRRPAGRDRRAAARKS